MTDFVIFTLVAPMGSFGGLAGHERRGSASWPGRSAILGLLGAALGLRREDRAGQEGLRSWQTAVSVLSEGYPLQDFHTVETVPSANVKHPATRRAALKSLKHSDNPVITRRDYRTDCAFGIAVWGGAGPDGLVQALRSPVFTPYLGRKSCPLSAPMAPQLVCEDTVDAALAQVVLPPFLAALSAVRIISDAPMPGAIEDMVWDEPLDRQRWHFGQRRAYIKASGRAGEGRG